MSDIFSAADILGPKGRIAQRLSSFEHRPEQLAMAAAVESAIFERKHLVVEAGTGTGKSFAYLVPAILAAAGDQNRDRSADDDDDDSKKRTRVVISTHTISLQEQLFERDIPFLNSILPIEFSAVLVKGRGNYLSLRRAAAAGEKARSLFSGEQSLDQLGEIRRWSQRTSDGTLSDLGFKPDGEVWDEVRSEQGNCLGRACPTYEQCFYFKARRRAWNADILVVNHALFFSDLALRREGASILPDYSIVVFDEAHTLEAVAADHLGFSISNGQVDYLLNKLYNDRTQKGLLVHHGDIAGQKLVSELRIHASDFFDAVRMQHEQRAAKNGRLREPVRVPVDLETPLRELSAHLSTIAARLPTEEQQIDVTSAADRAVTLAVSSVAWLKQQSADSVYWIEITGKRQERIKLLSAPVNVGPLLRDELFNSVPTAILTSATLAVGNTAGFGFVRDRLGIQSTNELQLGSPFEYRKNVRLILPTRMPDPTENAAAFEAAVIEHLPRYIEQTQGRAFVLFTSYRMLENCAAKLSGWFRRAGYTLFSQAEGTPRTILLDRFRTAERGVLFGADSFWQGVDVAGEALQNVIITKLPFSVPDHPLMEARLEEIRARKGNPFVEYQVPEAVIKFKQGFGRLIRTRTDKGQVVVLDPRIRTKPYGKVFLASLPECRLVMDDGRNLVGGDEPEYPDN